MLNGGVQLKSKLYVGDTKRYRKSDVIAQEGDEGCEAFRLVKRLRASEIAASGT